VRSEKKEMCLFNDSLAKIMQLRWQILPFIAGIKSLRTTLPNEIFYWNFAS
jgi:hypothetical protein